MSAAPANQTAVSAYLKVTGAKSGQVKGPVRDRDENKNGSIALLAVSHQITAPRDMATGQAVGKRQHFPITVTKETDSTSPLFYQFIATNESLTADIFFYGDGSPSGFTAGRETLLYKISLRNASVSKVEFAGHADETSPANARFALSENISIFYNTIAWEWSSPAVTAADNFVTQ